MQLFCQKVACLCTLNASHMTSLRLEHNETGGQIQEIIPVQEVERDYSFLYNLGTQHL